MIISLFLSFPPSPLVYIPTTRFSSPITHSLPVPHVSNDLSTDQRWQTSGCIVRLFKGNEQVVVFGGYLKLIFEAAVNARLQVTQLARSDTSKDGDQKHASTWYVRVYMVLVVSNLSQLILSGFVVHRQQATTSTHDGYNGGPSKDGSFPSGMLPMGMYCIYRVFRR